MKRFLLGLLIAGSCFGQNISINPVELVKIIRTKTSSTNKVRRITGLVLVSVNVLDWRTTMIGVDRGFCELNPWLVTTKCKLNEPRFTRAKLGVIGFAAMQELPIWNKHKEDWNKIFIISNIAASVPLGIAGVNNLRLLR